MSSPATASFTCISCHVAFPVAEQQRDHYKSDWHRYNLKRKVADLPPVNAEEFHRKVLNQRNLEEQAKQDPNVYCEICRKAFSNRNAHENHLNSKKHKDNAKSYSPDERQPFEGVVDEDVDSDEWEDSTENPIDANNCLFCLHHSRNFIKNLEHMTVAHSFFIPDIEYCTSVYGLIRYLGEKVEGGFMCLSCNEHGRSFHSAEAARNHMLDKGHCRILLEGLSLAEYADFYDFSSSYPDSDSADKDEEVNVTHLDDSDYQLVLPSGSSIGHRSLMRYYKQSINPNSAPPLNRAQKLNKVLACYRNMGWVATKTEEAAKKAKDLHFMRKTQAKSSLALGVKANKLQKHFRQQVNF